MLYTDANETLLAKADIIDQDTPNEIYLGFQSKNAGMDKPLWAICKIETVNNIITRKWVEGLRNETSIWDDRAALNYAFKTF